MGFLTPRTVILTCLLAYTVYYCLYPTAFEFSISKFINRPSVEVFSQLQNVEAVFIHQPHVTNVTVISKRQDDEMQRLHVESISIEKLSDFLSVSINASTTFYLDELRYTINASTTAYGLTTLLDIAVDVEADGLGCWVRQHASVTMPTVCRWLFTQFTIDAHTIMWDNIRNFIEAIATDSE